MGSNQPIFHNKHSNTREFLPTQQQPLDRETEQESY